MKEKIVLIDGHSIMNRAFYGVPQLTNVKGLHTNAIYGFLNIMFKILEEEKPQYLCVAFDVKAKTFRHKIFEAYKGTRKPMPQELHEQVPVLKEVLRAMQIKTIEMPGYEADDLLGTLAKRAEKKGMDVSLISGDRDLLQIASDVIKIRIPKTKGGKTETEDYYTKDVIEKYQVNPIQFIDLKALMGDTADNIPGVPKVGEKTATELMVRFGSLKGIYDNVETIEKKAIKESLIQNIELADLSKTLATINIDSPLEFDFEDARIQDFYTKEALKLFQMLEFKNYLNRFHLDVMGSDLKDKTKDYSVDYIHELEDACKVFHQAIEEKEVAFYLVEDKLGELIALGLAFEKNVFIFVINEVITKEYIKEQLQCLQEKVGLISFYCKQAYPYLNMELETNCFDTMIAAYLLNPLKNDYQIEDISNEYLGEMLLDYKQIFEKRTIKEAIEEKPEEFKSFVGKRVATIIRTKPMLEEKLKEQDMFTLFNEIEMPLTKVLFEMEQNGILADREELKNYGTSLIGRINELEKEIYSKAGTEFNINSPKQLGEVLFEQLGLPGGKKTKTGYSTAADVLEKLSAEYPIVSDILEYRGLTKLKSTYADGLESCIKEDGRIHTTFNQTITATGRISSTEPNLQNIPIRMELGRKIRKTFIPQQDYIFMDADYSQIELRLLAHMSGDEKLIEAYKMHSDIHRITASQVFHTPLKEVTDLQRRNAKAVNFGIVYGISSFGLSQGLSINRKEAAKYIEDYFLTYPRVKAFLDELVESAKDKGYVSTLFGRRRPIPELKSSNFMLRSFGERVAMNSPIQGTAADIMKIAMIHVSRELKKNKLKSKLLVQVHDELLLEVAKDEEEKVTQILTDEMVHAADLSVLLEVDVHTGKNWYEAK